MRGALHGGLWSFGYIVLCYALFIASVIVLVDRANSGLGGTGGSVESLASIVVYTIPTAVLSTASFILTFVSSIGVSMKRRDAREAFYGTSRPRIKQAPAISFEEYEKRSRAYVAALDAERKPSPKARNAIKGVSFGVVLLAAVITVIVVLSSYAGSAFNISKIKEIARGDSRDEVIELLGEPYGYDKDPDASVFVYYSENYASLLRRAEELGEDVDSFDDLENALEEAAKLEEQMWDMQYQVITVTFGADGVESVSYDAAHINSDVDPSKSYSTKTLLDENMNEIGSIEQFAETDLYYSVEYYDGSYYFGLLERGFVATVTGEVGSPEQRAPPSVTMPVSGWLERFQICNVTRPESCFISTESRVLETVNSEERSARRITCFRIVVFGSPVPAGLRNGFAGTSPVIPVRYAG